MFANIRALGPGSTILSTDLGQSNNPYVDDGLQIFIQKLLDADFEPTEDGTVAYESNSTSKIDAAGGKIFKIRKAAVVDVDDRASDIARGRIAFFIFICYFYSNYFNGQL